jgi:PilZ domain-containing protein
MSLGLQLTTDLHSASQQLAANAGVVFGVPRGSSVGRAATAEARVHERFPISGSVDLITYSPEQGAESVPAKALNMSGAGLMVSASQPLPVGSVAFIRSRELHFIAGWSCVRHCRRRGVRYNIGLKFLKPLSRRF